MDIFEVYASNIKKFRKEKNLSQSELAEKINLSVKYISDLETGRSYGSLDTLVCLAAAFEVAPYKLLMSVEESQNYDTYRTKELFSKMRNMYSEFVDTLENFLEKNTESSLDTAGF